MTRRHTTCKSDSVFRSSDNRVGCAEFPTTRSELNYVFDIIDNTHSGEITYKQFINVLHYDRPSKVTNNAPSCGAVYCNRPCMFVCVCVCVCSWVCYHDYSKLRASIFTKLGL